MIPGVLLVTSLLIAGCSSSPAPGQPVPSPTGSPAVAGQTLPTATESVARTESERPVAAATPGKTSPPKAETVSPNASPRGSAPPAPAPVAPQQVPDKESTPAPHPESTIAPPASSPPPPVAAHVPIAVDIGGLVEVGPTKPGLVRIGADKCKLCHKLQFTSWAKTVHAARTPPLDCESCHGPGSEYKSLAIMKDVGKARAAGLVIPTRAFCSKCHTSGWSDDLLKRTHEHKTVN